MEQDKTPSEEPGNQEQVFSGEAIPIAGDEEVNLKDLDDKYIMSKTLGVHKHSFVDARQAYDELCPPPKFFTTEDLLKPLPNTKDDILKGFKEGPQGGLICIDQESMDKQKGVFVDVVKQLTINLFKGLTITHISLPVKIFEPRSSVQRIVDVFAHSPIYLNRAAASLDHLERLKLVITNVLSSFYVCTSQMKPFNPILGETSQAKLADGTEIYVEHTSHHPPVSNFLMQPKDESYKFWGFCEYTATISGNSMIAGQKGPNHIQFADGQHIRYCLSDFRLGGTVMGERSVEASGNMVFEDLTNNRKAVILVNTYKKEGLIWSTETGKKDEFRGIIYDTQVIDPEASYKVHYHKSSRAVTDLAALDSEIVTKLADIEGSWLKNLKIGEEVYWDIEKETPFRQIPMTDEDQLILPSDWRYREDLMWLKYGNIPVAHNWKVRMEVQQRHDRAQRNAKRPAKH